MDLAEKPVRERESGLETREAVLESRDVSEDLLDVAERNSWKLLDLEQQQVGK